MLSLIVTFVKDCFFELALRGHITSTCDVDGHYLDDVSHQASVFRNGFCFCSYSGPRGPQLLRQVGKRKLLAAKEVEMQAVRMAELW